MIRFARRVGSPALSLVCVIALGWPHAVRSSIYRTLYPLTALDQPTLAAPPSDLAAVGYRVDSAAELSSFRDAADAATAGTSNDELRLRKLGDLIYSYHPGREPYPIIAGGRERGPSAIFADIRAGQFALCGQKTLVLAALWRSLGGDVRQIRFSKNDETAAWFASHYGIEVYSPQWSKWFYYDATLNGYAADSAGRPLSLVEINEHLALGDDLAMVASADRYDWDATQFLAFLRENRLQVYSLDNRLRGHDPDRRFGVLNFGYSWLSQLPRPVDRFVDTITGDAERRFIAQPSAEAPASAAKMHLNASFRNGQAPSP